MAERAPRRARSDSSLTADRGDQEGEECDPVLRVGDGEGADRRQEIVIKSEGGDHRHENGLPQAPGGGDPEDAQQESERDRGRIQMEPAVADESNSSDRQRRDQVSGSGSGGGFHEAIV